MNRTVLAVGILFLFIASTVTPAVISYDEPEEDDDYLENLAFMCYDGRGDNDRYEYYKEQMLKEHFDDDVEIVDKVTEPVELPQTSVSSGPMDSAWPMKCHDAYHTSQSPYSTADNPGIEKWRFECDWLEDTPVVDSDGTIYFGSCDRYIYALYSDGTLKWKYKLGGNILGSSPAIDEDGTIYIGSWDCNLYAINPNGTLKWAVGSGGSIFSSPTVAEDGTIYFGTLSSGNSIVAVNPNGTKKWSYKTGNSVTSDPAIGDDGTIYCGSGDSYLYALYPNGTLRWKFKTGDDIKGPPSIANDGTIYIGSYDKDLYAIYPNGTLKWKCNIGYGIATNPSIASDGTIYVGGNNLYAIYPNGTIRWSFDMGGNRHIDSSSPAVSADGTIYIGTNIGNMEGGEIIAVNQDGTEKWRKKIADEWVESSPSITEDGTVYIGSSSLVSGDDFGYLHAFGTVEDNEPPSVPVITGETNGNTGESYTYTFVSNDPENYHVKYFIEWGDDTTTGWTWEYESSEEVEISHTWSEQGTYEIRAKAMDISNYESDWGTLEVTMPVNQNIQINSQQSSTPLFFQILQRLLNIR